MILTLEQKQYLNAYSKMLYGSLNYWQNKLVKKGIRKNDEEMSLDPRGSHVKYLTTFEEVKEYMERVYKARQELMKPL